MVNISNSWNITIINLIAYKFLAVFRRGLDNSNYFICQCSLCNSILLIIISKNSTCISY